MKKDIADQNKNSSSGKAAISRRKFLKSSLLITAGITFAGCSETLLSPNVQDSSKGKIVIIGAGLSGLVSAYELSKVGYDVMILEASDRIGGRVYTLREPFADEQFAEAGAARIPPNHNHTHHYINEFGLELSHFYPRNGDYIRYNGNNRQIISNEDYLTQRPWPGSVTHAEYSKIKGGSDKLTEAFHKKLSGKIFLNSPVTSIDQRSGKVKVRTRYGNIFTADRVIVSIPLTVLNKIEFIPQLSSNKIDAANGGFNYATSTRVYLQTETKFWQNENLNGWGTTNWPEEMWQPTFDQNGLGGILMNYTTNRRADQLDVLTNEERINSLINRWKEIFPSIESNFLRGTSYSWADNEWARGAYASPTFNQAETYDQSLASPEGKIYFAGEHISNYHGWMQGALASGLRAVNEIIESEMYV